ncbi:MAG TPA: hypothetical protein DHV25_01950 [Candidatus Kerfeldbacteria bacterium]|nr:MAG: Inositol monophosphatase [Parcubacteria group bacterium GW2011_GWC2_49_9]HCJ52466.1 hypothetical protein [Candidatus Kerfeldbacteria bacterium]
MSTIFSAEISLQTVRRSLRVMVSAAEAGGRVVRGYFGEELRQKKKTHESDFVTRADLGSESAILSVLTRKFPKYNIISEEAGMLSRHSDFTVVVDPLDGTYNFVIGIPNFTVPIALLYRKMLLASVIYHPLLHTTYSAIRGQGAYVGNRRLHVNKVRELSHSTIAFMASYRSSGPRNHDIISRLTRHGSKRILTSWSPAYDYCMLASGKIEAIVNVGAEIHDYYAGRLLAAEAGARFCDFDGRRVVDTDHRFLCANGSKLLNKLVTSIQ